MLVYDITNPKSFEQLDSWREEFLHQVGVVLLEVECCPAREGDLGRANTAFSVFDPRVRCRERSMQSEQCFMFSFRGAGREREI